MSEETGVIEGGQRVRSDTGQEETNCDRALQETRIFYLTSERRLRRWQKTLLLHKKVKSRVWKHI